MDKFNRTYRLTIFPIDGGKPIVIYLPFTLQFSVMRGAGANLNSANFIIYNLGEETRSRIFQDRFNISTYQKITFEAGYNNEFSMLFKGNICEAGSMRKGTDVITTIFSRDGAYDAINTKSSQTLQAGISNTDAIKSLIGDYPNLNQGVIGGDDFTYGRAVVIDQNTWKAIQTLSNNKCFIDLEEINILGDNQAKVGLVPIIDDTTGLLETPRKENANLIVRTLFEPRIIMGQVIEVRSSIQPVYNGQYKVIGVKHNGIISDAVNGQCESEFNLLAGVQLFKRGLQIL